MLTEPEKINILRQILALPVAERAAWIRYLYESRKTGQRIRLRRI